MHPAGDAHLWVVVMAGGAGTRFWPASTTTKPKQLLPLLSPQTLLQESVARARLLVDAERVLVVTSSALASAIAAQLPEVPRNNILAEPERKDTAAAVTWALRTVRARDAGAVVAVLTSDHAIAPVEAFAANIASAVETARAHSALVTFGIPPTHAATGFGYLELGEGDRVRRFVEKPDQTRAQTLVAQGCLWNSGMFVFSVAAGWDAVNSHLPSHAQAFERVVDNGDFAAVRDAFAAVPRISFDFGVMEKAPDVRCVRATFSWSDVGSFPALADHLPHDAHQNAANVRLATLDAARNVVWSQAGDELVALVGVTDLVVVRAGSRTLIAPRSRAEDIKKLVDALAPADRESPTD